MAHNSETDDSNAIDENHSIEFNSQDSNFDFLGEDGEFKPKATDPTNSISVIKKRDTNPLNNAQSIQALLSGLPPIPKPTDNSISGIPVIESSSNFTNSSLHFPPLETNNLEANQQVESPRKLLTISPKKFDTSKQNTTSLSPQETSIQEKSSTIKVSITPKFLLKSSIQQKSKNSNQAQVKFNPEQTPRRIVVPNIESNPQQQIGRLNITTDKVQQPNIQTNYNQNDNQPKTENQTPTNNSLYQSPISNYQIPLTPETERVAKLFENRFDLSLTALKRSITCEISHSLYQSLNNQKKDKSSSNLSTSRLPSTFESDVDSLIDSINHELVESISFASVYNPYIDSYSQDQTGKITQKFRNPSNIVLSNMVSNVINEELNPILTKANATFNVYKQLNSEKERRLTNLNNELESLRSIFKTGCGKLFDQLNRRSLMIDYKNQEEMRIQQNLQMKLNKIRFLNRELGIKKEKLREEKRKK